ncbi:MAG: hypothetical protein HYT49_00795 [Candidatus Wildermuthbacteria bacterium]|nr:hypothetical protein [Candidatus Wildermuthbacteria bacterium]
MVDVPPEVGAHVKLIADAVELKYQRIPKAADLAQKEALQKRLQRIEQELKLQGVSLDSL